MSTLGERIKYAREAKGLLQQDLAKQIGVKSSGVISNWEKNLNKPDAEKIVKLCEVLDISTSFLLDYHGKSAFEVHLSEIESIRKYRFVMLHFPEGARMIDAILDREYEIAGNMQKQAERVRELEKRISELEAEN
ncbi:MAG: helix-turn-helix domain-containing protein [Lachnospiraceae bacterium]|nr:helix-turn-helix domain-containing protein [Lachnospiraceae bacterium]